MKIGLVNLHAWVHWVRHEVPELSRKYDIDVEADERYADRKLMASDIDRLLRLASAVESIDYNRYPEIAQIMRELEIPNNETR